MHPVARYLSIDAAADPAFAIDGSLLYLLDTTGTPQVWRRHPVAAADRSRAGRFERLTAESERISFVDASPTRREFAFGMDQGSNERDQLFRYDLDTGEQRSLTDRPESIHLWGGWSPDGDRFAFAANRRRRDRFDVYVQPRTGGPEDANLIYEGPGGFLSVEGWGPDGDRLAITRARSSAAADVFVLSVSSGSITQLTEDDDARYESLTFGSDGGLYCLSNEPGDTLVFGRIDVARGGAVETVVDGDGWNVDGYAFDRDTGSIVYTRNVDGFSTLHLGRLVDPVTIEPIAEPDVGEDVIEAVDISPGGNRYAVARSASDTPHSIASGAFESPTERPDVVVPVGTLGIPTERFRSPSVVRYESFDGRRIPAYWTLPSDAPEGETPVIVDIHGGPEHQRRPWFYPTKQYFLANGYAIFEPNVRGSSGYGKAYTHLDDVERRMDSVADVEAAVEWLSEQPAVDPNRIVAYGRSYGGFMVLAAITQYPDLWRAAVEFVGIADFETFLENTGAWRRRHREAEYGSLESDRELLESISPIHDVDQIACPLFIQHGANDPRVPVGETEAIAEALESRDVPVETLIFEDEGHHTTDRTNRIETFERVAAFLDRHV
ncbi:MAG: S9 family peptidase [Halobacteriota archaeon]